METLATIYIISLMFFSPQFGPVNMVFEESYQNEVSCKEALKERLAEVEEAHENGSIPKSFKIAGEPDCTAIKVDTLWFK